MMGSNIILLGFMGCGKTVIGKKLAKKLDYHFVDTDDLVVQYASMSIPHIFEKYGESYFRELETRAAEESAQNTGYVISTGGGIIKKKQNMDILKQSGTTVYLQATPEKIYQNTRNDTNRPLLLQGDWMENIMRLLAEREHLYTAYGDITVNVTKLNIEQSAAEIIKALQKNE